MSLYVYKPDSDTFDSLSLANKSGYDRLSRLVGPRMAAGWRPLTVQVHKGNRSGDFPSLASHVPVFSRKALDALQPLIGDTVEVLPLKCSSTDLFAINVLMITDCFDESNASFERDQGGDVFYISRYAFDEQCLRGKHIFKIRQAPLHDVFVSEEFKQAVEQNGLQGLRFRKVA